MAYVDNPNGFYCVGTLASKELPPIRRVRLAVSQTIHAGDLLITDTDGYATIALSDSGQLAFLAMEDKTSSAASHPWIQVIYLMPDVVIVGQCSGTPAQTNIFQPCDIEGTTGIMEINENLDNEKVLLPINLADVNEGFGANARLECIVLRSPWNLAAV